MRHRFNPPNGSMTMNVIPCYLFCRSGLCLVPSAIHLRSKRQATIIFAGITIHKKDILKNFFVYLMMTNVMVKTCLNQKIIKKSNLIQAMKNNICPKATVIRRPNFSEHRICLKIYRMFRSVDWTHDMIIVKWHLFIWHERKFCALTIATPVQSTQTGQWLSTLFHARRSGLSLVPSAIHLPSKVQATIIFAGITIHKKDILKIFLCIWWWQMLWWKHVLTRKL